MKTKRYIFWIRSNRGTNIQKVVKLDASLKEKGIMLKLEDWCFNFGAWHHSDNIIEYGVVEGNNTNLNKLSKYNNARSIRSEQINLLTKKFITLKDYDRWLKKNDKRLKFPFK